MTEEKIYTLQGEKTWDRSQGVMRIIKFKYRHTEKAHWEGKNGQKKLKREAKGRKILKDKRMEARNDMQ